MVLIFTIYEFVKYQPHKILFDVSGQRMRVAGMINSAIAIFDLLEDLSGSSHNCMN